MNTKQYLFLLGLAGLSWLDAGFCLSARGAITTNVSVGPNGTLSYSPSTVAINVNDSVQWVWVSGFHSSTSDTSLWDSGQMSSGTFTFTFANSGTFTYFCTVHGHIQAGSVVVSSANLPPSVSITNPTSGATFASPWTSTLKASVTPGSGTVTNVQFFNSTTSLGSVAVSPFNLTVTNEPAGSYSLKAVASDNLGSKGTSGVVNVAVVAPVDISISSPKLLAPSAFRLTYTANSGLTYVVQRAATLPNFTGIFTNTASASSVSFTDAAASAAINFYRVQRLPNP